MDLLQIFTLITGVIYIIFEIRQKNFMWVVGVVTSLAAMWVFFRQGLYASFGLNTYYFITAFIGLWHWRRDKNALSSSMSGTTVDSSPMSVVSSEVASPSDIICLNRLTTKTVIISAIAMVIGVFALSWGMEYLNSTGLLTENPMSLLDSSVAVLSAIATWWLVKSYREQWLLWIVADTLSVVLCAMQQMWWMSVLYVAYVAAAVYGLYYWKKAGVYLAD